MAILQLFEEIMAPRSYGNRIDARQRGDNAPAPLLTAI